MDSLVELIKNKVNYVVQESIIVIKDIFRKYPNRFEGVIAILCENLSSLDEPAAKSSMIWIIGHYADRIDKSEELLGQFLNTFVDQSTPVQHALLTAITKLFLKNPTKGQELISKVLKLSTEDTENPDLRDRGYMYWRLISTDPIAAKKIIINENAMIDIDRDLLHSSVLQELLLNLGNLNTIHHRPAMTFYGDIKQKTIRSSPAYVSERTWRADEVFEDSK